MTVKHFIVTLFLMMTYNVYSQSIQGSVIDKNTKKPLPYVEIYLVNFNIHTLTNEDGEFTIKGKFPDKITLQATLFGYKPITSNAISNQTIHLALEAVHYELEGVTITASKHKLVENSISHVDVRSVEELNQLPSRTIGDMISKFPGVYNLSTGPGVSKPVIRGLSGMRVMTLLDGVRLEGQQWGGDHGMGLSELGIGTIEVLKGPSSLKYGSNALGGIVYLSTVKYEKQHHHSMQVESDFESNSMGISNSILYRGSTNNLKIIAGGRYANHADYQAPNGDYTYNTRFQNSQGKIALGWHKNKWVSNLSYNYSNSFIGIPGHNHEEHEHGHGEEEHSHEDEGLVAHQKRNVLLPYQHLINHIAIWENKLVSKKHTFQLIASFTLNSLAEFEEDLQLPNMLINTYNVPYQLNIDSRLNKQITFSYGLQGMFLTQHNGKHTSERLVPDADQLDNGLYFITTWEREKIKLQAGLRGDLRTVETNSDYKFTSQLNKEYYGFNFSLGANYTLEEGQILRINVSTGHRIPHIAELMSNGEHHGTGRYEIGDRTLVTEKALQVDISYEFLGEHLSVIINPFINGIKDYIYLLPTDSMIDDAQLYHYKQSTSPVLQSGIDFGVHYHPHFAHFLHFRSSFSYLRFFTEEKNEIALIPQPRLSSSIIAKFNMKSKLKIDNVVLQHDYFLPQRMVSHFETPSVDFSVFDVGMQFSLAGKVPLQLQIGVRNVLNKQYVNHLSRLKQLGLYNPGRSYYAKLIVKLNFKARNK